MLNLFVKAPIKIVATFIISLGLLLGGFVYFPEALTTAQDWANNLSDAIRDLPPDQQSRVLWRTATDSNAILAVFITILSRSIVEIGAQLGGLLLKSFGVGHGDHY